MPGASPAPAPAGSQSSSSLLPSSPMGSTKSARATRSAGTPPSSTSYACVCVFYYVGSGPEFLIWLSVLYMHVLYVLALKRIYLSVNIDVYTIYVWVYGCVCVKAPNPNCHGDENNDDQT